MSTPRSNEHRLPEGQICQHTPCDCCEVYCDHVATVVVMHDSRLIGYFCEEHSREYIWDEE